MTEEQLEEFFRRCSQIEIGEEPDWREHLKVIDQAKASGSANS
jgi:hypothetical protein